MKIPVESSNGKRTWRYFTKEQVDKDEVRKKVESIPFEERKKLCKQLQGVLGSTCADFSCMTSKWVSRWQQNSSKSLR